MKTHHVLIGDTSTHSWWISQPAMLVAPACARTFSSTLANLNISKGFSSGFNELPIFKPWVFLEKVAPNPMASQVMLQKIFKQQFVVPSGKLT